MLGPVVLLLLFAAWFHPPLTSRSGDIKFILFSKKTRSIVSNDEEALPPSLSREGGSTEVSCTTRRNHGGQQCFREVTVLLRSPSKLISRNAIPRYIVYDLSIWNQSSESCPCTTYGDLGRLRCLLLWCALQRITVPCFERIPQRLGVGIRIASTNESLYLELDTVPQRSITLKAFDIRALRFESRLLCLTVNIPPAKPI